MGRCTDTFPDPARGRHGYRECGQPAVACCAVWRWGQCAEHVGADFAAGQEKPRAPFRVVAGTIWPNGIGWSFEVLVEGAAGVRGDREDEEKARRAAQDEIDHQRRLMPALVDGGVEKRSAR